jgi:ribosome-binding protein aMBF1 (putative translation factor)
MHAISIVIEGKEYVIMPKREYQRLAGPASVGDARGAIRAALGERLRAARERAGLSQQGLAERMDVSQPMVSGAERGRVRVSERYAKAVLKACGLPRDWAPPNGRRADARSAR